MKTDLMGIIASAIIFLYSITIEYVSEIIGLLFQIVGLLGALASLALTYQLIKKNKLEIAEKLKSLKSKKNGSDNS